MKLMVLAVALSLPLTIMGQSVNSGLFQVLGSFDASAGIWSKPMVAVTSDPSGACSNAASMVINISAGSQKGDISACINGAWTLVNGSISGAGIAQFAPSYSGGGVTFGSCSAGSPCYLAPNNQLDTYISMPAVTPAAGTAADTLFIYGVPGNNTIQVGIASTNTYGCSGCQINSGISAPPSNSYPIYKCIVTGGQIVSGGCTPLSTPYSNTSFENGLGTLPLVDTATGALQINNNRNPRIVTSGNDTITNLDCGGMVIYKETSAMNVALPQAGIGNPVTFASGCDIWLVNIGTGSVQINPNSSSPINGSTATQTLAAASASAPTGIYLVSTGSAFDGVVIGGGGSGVSSGGPVSISGSNPQVQISNPTTNNYLSYQLNGDTQKYQLGLGNSGAGSLLATNFYLYDGTNGAPRMVMNNASDVLWNGTTTSPSGIDGEVTAASPGAEWLGNGTTKNVLLQLQNTNASWAGNANVEFKTSGGNSYLGVGGPSSPTVSNALYVTLPTSGLLFEAPFSTGIFEIQHGLSVGINGITFSSTPTFDLSKGDPTITLTANVTSSTVTNLVKGARVVFQICQDATGSRTFVWPSNVRGAMTIGATAGKCNVQMFESFDGANLVALGPGVTNQ